MYIYIYIVIYIYYIHIIYIIFFISFMVTHCIFLKKYQCLNCNNSYNICRCVKYVKIGCLLSLFEKENRTENVKMLQFQNNCINNGVAYGLKQKKKKSI